MTSSVPVTLRVPRNPVWTTIHSEPVEKLVVRVRDVCVHVGAFGSGEREHVGVNCVVAQSDSDGSFVSCVCAQADGLQLK
jgi:hypothetical protein